MKQPIRSFSVGLFTAGIILLIIFYFFGDSTGQPENPPMDEMIAAVENDGYHVVTESDYISMSVQKETNGENDSSDEGVEQEDSNAKEDQEDEPKNDNDSNDDEQNDEETDSEIITYTLNIEEGMPSSEISTILVDNKIIDDANEFNHYLQEEGYDLKVQIGESQVSSDMSFFDIAEEITK